MDLLEAIRPTLHYLCARLDRTASSTSTQSDNVARLAQRLQTNLCSGYKAVILAALADKGGDGALKTVSLAIHRALSDLSRTLLRTLQFYVAPADRLWLELNQLYLLGEQMAPGAFLRTAIDNDVAGKIDRWVILQSIKMLSTHRAKGNNTRLTINLTCNSVTDPDFTQWLGVAIKAARLPSDAVIFQVTEKDASTYIRQTREFFEKLKEMYCRASISRFRMTPDSFEVLNHIPAEFVKLDGTKIEDMGDDDEMREAVTNTLRKLQAAGNLSIVPMVETANILSTLWQAGANYIQGHYLQEPSAEMDYDFSTDD
jgi:EAL domain-containing protein (putative c-di-GMP-specific phosphodiesterase class I)